MKLIRLIFAIVGLLIFTVAVDNVRAQEANPGEPPREKISTLNNQLVKVGDQNQYLYEYRPWNISTNPIGWILGSYGLSVSYAFHPNFAVRGDVNYVEDISDTDSKGMELALTVPIYFRKMYSDYYLEPGFTYKKLEIENEDAKVYGPAVLFGHHWYWDSGLNISAALGFGRNWSNVKETQVEAIDKIAKFYGTGYLRFGYAF